MEANASLGFYALLYPLPQKGSDPRGQLGFVTLVYKEV